VLALRAASPLPQALRSAARQACLLVLELNGTDLRREPIEK
jgi:hypothetical protein